MKMAGFYDESISNGLGWRAVLFVSGCPHHCPGCHNQVAQDYNYGEEFDEKSIIERIKNNSILKGITISGGEPLCKENIAGVNKFIENIKKEKPDFDVWCYTGYTLEELKSRGDEVTNQTLNNIDVLVTIGNLSKYIHENANIETKYHCNNNEEAILLLKKIVQNDDIILFKASNSMNFIEIVNNLT